MHPFCSDVSDNSITDKYTLINSTVKSPQTKQENKNSLQIRYIFNDDLNV